MASSVANLPESVPGPVRASLAAATEAWCALLGPRLHSLVLFGSVARGRSTARSDVDLLVIAEGFPRSLLERRRVFLEDGRWYWDLKPDFRFGDVVEI